MDDSRIGYWSVIWWFPGDLAFYWKITDHQKGKRWVRRIFRIKAGPTPEKPKRRWRHVAAVTTDHGRWVA